MDITVYLPDEIGARAKTEKLNLSRLLRDAVAQELDRRRAMSNTLTDIQTHEVELEDKNGSIFTGRITGKVIADDDGDVTVYLTDDERVIVYDESRLRYEIVDDPEEGLRGLTPGAYSAAMDALGIKPVIDL